MKLHALLLSGLFPADPTKRRVEDNTAMEVKVAASGVKDGNTMAMNMTKNTSRESKISSN
jgi:hypothetical protein